MTNRKNNKIYMSYAILFFLIAFQLSATPQSVSNAADELVAKLKQKVLLNQNQADEIKKSLNEYLTNPTENNKSSLEYKIESLLEEKQKMKYSIIRKDWWESVSKEVNKNNKEKD